MSFYCDYNKLRVHSVWVYMQIVMSLLSENELQSTVRVTLAQLYALPSTSTSTLPPLAPLPCSLLSHSTRCIPLAKQTPILIPTRKCGESVAVRINLPSMDHLQCNVFDASIVDILVSGRLL